jgi:WD40 repeat protein
VALTFNPPSTLLASGSLSGQLILWDMPSGSRRAVLREGDKEGVDQLQFSPDASRLASVGSGSVDVFALDPKTRSMVADGSSPIRLRAEPGEVILALRWEDSSKLLLVSSGGTLRRWDVMADQATTLWGPPLERAQASIQTAALSLDGKTAAVFYRRSEELYLVDTPTGDKRKKLAIGKTSILNGLAFSPDGRWLAVVTDKSRRIQRFDTRTGSAQASSPIRTEYVHDVVWHPKSSQLAAVDFDDRAEGTVVLVDVPAKVRRTQSTRMDASNTATYSPSGAWLAVGDYSGRIRLFDPATGALKMALSEQLQNGGMIACSPKDPSVVVSNARYGLLHWNLAKGTLEVMGSPPRDVEALVWVKESDHLVGVESRGHVTEWDLQGKELRRTKLADWPDPEDNLRVVLDASGTIVAARSGKTLGIWNTAGGKRRVLAEKLFDEGYPTGLALSPKGDHLAVAGFQGMVILETQKGEPIAKLETGKRAPYITGVGGETMGWSTDGTLLAVGSSAHDKVDLWDIKSGKIKRSISKANPKGGFVPSPDGNWIATNRGVMVEVAGDRVTRTVETRAVPFGPWLDLSEGTACWLHTSQTVVFSRRGGLAVWDVEGRDRYYTAVPFESSLAPFVLDGKGGFDGLPSVFPTMEFLLGGKRVLATELAERFHRPGLAAAR